MEEMIQTEKKQKQTGPDFTLEFIDYEIENSCDIKESTVKEQCIYHVKVTRNDGKSAKIEITVPDLYKGKWLDKIPFIVRYKSKKAVEAMIEECIREGEQNQEPYAVRFDKIGWQNHPKYGAIFLFSNGAMTEHGFREDIYSTISGYDYICGRHLEDKRKSDQLEFLKKVALGDQAEIVWIHTLMSIIRQPLRQHGINLGITLLIYGKPASGKTELMKNFTNVLGLSDDKIRDRMLQTGTSTMELLARQAESKGIPVMLDDVKKESGQASREHSELIIDTMVRSGYEGKITKTYRQSDINVATNLVITGEYVRPSRSQMGRMLWLNADGYLKDSRHCDNLRNVQDHPEYAGSVYGGFIRWFAKKLNEDGTVAYWKSKYFEVREKNRTYLPLEDGVRIQEDDNILKFTYFIIKQYLEEEFTLKEEERVDLDNSVKNNIKRVIYQTAEQLGGMKSIYMRIWEEIIMNSRIREARYYESPAYRRNSEGLVWDQREFCLQEGDEFLYIPDLAKAGTEKEYFESVNPHSVLIIPKEIMEEKFRNAKRHIMAEGGISTELYEQISLEKMANYGILMFTTEKTKGTVRRRFVRPYPYLTETETQHGDYDNYGFWEEWTEWDINRDEKSALSFNMNSLSSEWDDQEIVTSMEMHHKLSGSEEQEIQAEIRRFMSGKMIYREE